EEAGGISAVDGGGVAEEGERDEVPPLQQHELAQGIATANRTDRLDGGGSLDLAPVDLGPFAAVEAACPRIERRLQDKARIAGIDIAGIERTLRHVGEAAGL